jgi:hypothetical protein
MHKSVRILLSLWGLALAPVAMHGPAWAQAGTQGAQGAQGAPGSESRAAAPVAVEEELVTIPVTVEEIDKKNRTMTVRTADGERIPLTVPPDVQNFDKLKKGEKIDIDYYRAVAVRVIPGGAAGSASQAAQNAPIAQGGKGPQTTSSGKVTSVDRNDHTMKVKGDDGKSQTMSVRDPSLQNQVQGIKPGDLVEITYTEAVLAAVRSQDKKKK